jgi:thiamine-monophosphate kinase
VSRDEFEIIQRYFSRTIDDPGVLVGVGDDAAVIQPAGAVAITTDTLVSGVHFPASLPAAAIGYRVMAVNLSDLAAMGARPRWCTLALTIPDADESWLEAFAEGFYGLAERFSVSLIGGDLTRGPLAVTVQLLGAVSPRDLLTRGGGHVGDDVYVTGSLGDSAAGLALLTEGVGNAGPEHEALKDRFLWPTPRVAEGRVIGPLASAAIDVSDGLLADLGHLCAASRCAALVDVEQLPLSAELLALFPPQAAQAYALGGGDDYELCFTAPPAQAQALEIALESVGSRARRIGRLAEGQGVTCRRDGAPFAPPSAGYTHF